MAFMRIYLVLVNPNVHPAVRESVGVKRVMQPLWILGMNSISVNTYYKFTAR